jgi:hypothetical protein
MIKIKKEYSLQSLEAGESDSEFLTSLSYLKDDRGEKGISQVQSPKRS